MPHKMSATSHIRNIPTGYKHPYYKVPIGQTSTLKTDTNKYHYTHPNKSGTHPTHTLTQNPYGTIPTPNLSEGNYTTPVQWL